MKWLMALGALVLGGGGAWLLSNAARASWVNEIEIRIGRPAGDVFPWLTDPAKRLQWILFLRDSQRAAPGCLRETIVDHGRRFDVELHLTRIEPGRVLQTTAWAGDFDWVQTYELSGEGGSTTLRITIDTRYKPFLARALGPLVSRDVQATWQRHARKLRDLLEQAGR